jgi:hypothetical protein
MERLARFGVLTVLHRLCDRTVIYCRGDHISAELAATLTQNATLYTGANVPCREALGPRRNIDWIRIPRAELPPNSLAMASMRADTGVVSYVAAEHITTELADQLAEITAEEARYRAFGALRHPHSAA